jgi:transposase
MKSLDPKRLVFLDESGFKTSLCRFYGWAPIGTKPVIIAMKHGKNLSVIGAIAVDGVRTMKMLESSLDGAGFIEFLSNDLGPKLRRGDIVVMDGPRLHRVDGVAEALAARGATPLYLPPYSPELNPIEMCWALMKAWVRGRSPRVLRRLIEVVEEAWGTVTSEVCTAWVRHCGYAAGST